MSLTITLNNLSPAPARRDQELTILVEALNNVGQSMRAPGGSVTSGSIFIAGANGPVNVGSFSWTPQASS